MSGMRMRKKGHFASYLGLLGGLVLAALLIIASTLLFSQTA